MFEDELAALQGIFDSVLELPSTIVSALVALVYLLLYPVVLFLDMGYSWVVEILGSYVAILAVLYDIGATVSTDVVGLFDGVFPSSWVILLGSVVVLNVAIRAYYILKGVSIFGWSL